MTEDMVDIQSTKGKDILAHALNAEYCVLEFEATDDGSLMVADITEHVRELEKRQLDRDPAAPIDTHALDK